MRVAYKAEARGPMRVAYTESTNTSKRNAGSRRRPRRGRRAFRRDGLVENGGYAVLPFRLPGPYRPFGYITHEDRQTPALIAFREGLAVDIGRAYARARDICERAFAKPA